MFSENDKDKILRDFQIQTDKQGLASISDIVIYSGDRWKSKMPGIEGEPTKHGKSKPRSQGVQSNYNISVENY